MYKIIKNPYTGKEISINSKKGVQILKKYINKIQNGGATDATLYVAAVLRYYDYNKTRRQISSDLNELLKRKIEQLYGIHHWRVTVSNKIAIPDKEEARQKALAKREQVLTHFSNIMDASKRESIKEVLNIIVHSAEETDEGKIYSDIVGKPGKFNSIAHDIIYYCLNKVFMSNKTLINNWMESKGIKNKWKKKVHIYSGEGALSEAKKIEKPMDDFVKNSSKFNESIWNHELKRALNPGPNNPFKLSQVVQSSFDNNIVQMTEKDIEKTLKLIIQTARKKGILENDKLEFQLETVLKETHNETETKWKKLANKLGIKIDYPDQKRKINIIKYKICIGIRFLNLYIDYNECKTRINKLQHTHAEGKDDGGIQEKFTKYSELLKLSTDDTDNFISQYEKANKLSLSTDKQDHNYFNVDRNLFEYLWRKFSSQASNDQQEKWDSIPSRKRQAITIENILYMDEKINSVLNYYKGEEKMLIEKIEEKKKLYAFINAEGISLEQWITRLKFHITDEKELDTLLTEKGISKERYYFLVLKNESKGFLTEAAKNEKRKWYDRWLKKAEAAKKAKAAAAAEAKAETEEAKKAAAEATAKLKAALKLKNDKERQKNKKKKQGDILKRTKKLSLKNSKKICIVNDDEEVISTNTKKCFDFLKKLKEHFKEDFFKILTENEYKWYNHLINKDYEFQ